MEAACARYEKRGAAGWITLDRPESRNALSAALVNQVHDLLCTAERDPAVRAIIFTGAGTAFCAGADLKSPPGSAVAGAAGKSLPDLLAAMLACEKPVIAAVNGAAFAGGLGLVGAADIAIAAEDAPMSFSEVRIGVIPAVISVVCIPKLGPANAMKLFLTGERFSGADAVGLGLVHRAVPVAGLAGAVDAVVEMIAAGGPEAVREAKRLVARVARLPTAEGFAVTAPWSLERFASAEAAEGMAAFREKRRPAWAADAEKPSDG